MEICLFWLEVWVFSLQSVGKNLWSRVSAEQRDILTQNCSMCFCFLANTITAESTMQTVMVLHTCYA